MSGKVLSILVAGQHGDPQQPLAAARLEEGNGLLGDRHAGSGIVSLIEREGIDTFNAETGLSASLADIRRNIVTEGIDLNALVGKRFRIGDVELEGTELCEPCATLGKLLSAGDVSPADVVRHFAHSAGIRAKVLSSGAIAPGDPVG